MIGLTDDEMEAVKRWSTTGVLEALADGAAATGRTVGFAPHVDDAAMAAADGSGCDEVLARSAFFRRFPEV